MTTSRTITIDRSGATQGDTLYFTGSVWTRLGAGTSGQLLSTGGTGGNPSWVTGFAVPTGTGLVKVTAGVLDAAASLLVNADVSASAAIAGSKISPLFGAQAIQGVSLDTASGVPLSIALANASAVNFGGAGTNFAGVVALNNGATLPNNRRLVWGTDASTGITTAAMHIHLGSAGKYLSYATGSVGYNLAGLDGSDILQFGDTTLVQATGINGSQVQVKATSSSLMADSTGVRTFAPQFEVRGTNDVAAITVVGASAGVNSITAATTTTKLTINHASSAGNQLAFEANGVSFFTATGSYGGGSGVLFISNATTAPTTTPTGGGILYVEAGNLKYKGSNGNVFILGST